MRFRQKVILSIALPLYFALFYFTLQRVVVVVPHQFMPTRIDDAISFDPRWTLVHLSIVLLLPLALIGDLRRYARGFIVITIISFVFFFVFPVEGPRPNVMANNRVYEWLITIDRNLNTFPSLPAALAVYSLLFAMRILPKTLVAVATIWVALMLYASLAIKQHSAIDVIAGVLLAVAAHVFAARSHHQH